MTEFNYIFISILFGLAGTFILLFSNILSYMNNIKNKEKFSLVSQLIGFLFLFNSFLYQLFPKIDLLDLIGVVVYPPRAGFSYWPYYCFIIAGIFISLALVKEKDFGGRLEIAFDINSLLKLGAFYSPFIFACIALFLNEDVLLFVNIFVWFYFMMMLWEKD